MDTQSQETIREQAIRLYAQKENADMEHSLKQDRERRAEEERSLGKAMKELFNEVTYRIERAAPDHKPYALVPDFPEIRFFAQGWPNWMTAHYHADIPTGPEYDEWYENPLNSDYPDEVGINKLADIGRALKLWEKCDKTIHPWPDKAPVVEPTKPPRFALLLLSEANAETRPFTVVGFQPETETDYPRLAVEYTDI